MTREEGLDDDFEKKGITSFAMSDVYMPFKRSQRLVKCPIYDDILNTLTLQMDGDELCGSDGIVLPPSPFPSTVSEEELFISSIAEDEQDCNLLDMSITESLFEKALDESVDDDKVDVSCVKEEPTDDNPKEEEPTEGNPEEEEPKPIKEDALENRIERPLTLGSLLKRKRMLSYEASLLSKRKFEIVKKNMTVTAEKAVVRFTFKPPFPLLWYQK